MEQLADNGDGNFAYNDTLEEARKLCVEDLTSTLQVIARDAKVQVDFNPEVVAYYRLMGYENRDVADQDFRNDAVDAGEIGSGHRAAALYTVTFRSNLNGRIATVQLRWEDSCWLVFFAAFHLHIPSRWYTVGESLVHLYPRIDNWSSRLIGYRQCCGMTRKWRSSPG